MPANMPANGMKIHARQWNSSIVVTLGGSNVTNSASGVYNITNSASGGGVVATLQSRSHNQSLNLVLCLENCWLKARKCDSSYRLSVTFTFSAFYYQELFNRL